MYAAHYNTQRPHRALQLRPPRPESPVPEPVHGRVRRRPVLGGLINEYEPAPRVRLRRQPGLPDPRRRALHPRRDAAPHQHRGHRRARPAGPPPHRLTTCGVTEVAVAPGGDGDGDDGARTQRFVICHNPEQGDRDQQVRANLVAHLRQLIEGSDTWTRAGATNSSAASRPSRGCAATCGAPRPGCCASTRARSRTGAAARRRGNDQLVARHPEAFADHAADFWRT